MARRWVVLMLIFLLPGCATPRLPPIYHAKAIDKRDGALVYSSSNYWKYHVELNKVDGVEVHPWDRATGPILVDPGTRILIVSGHYHPGYGSSLIRYRGQVEFKVILQAGHTYRIQFEGKEDFMTLWIEDEKTHEAVSERKSPHEITTYWKII